MIKLQIVGNLGKDCIVKEVNGKNVINFSVAHTERFKDSRGNQKEKTTWVECAYWTDRTAISPYLLKGQMVYAEGTPEADGYTNKEGNPAATLRMRVQNIQLLGGKNEGNNGSPQIETPSYSNAGNVTNSGSMQPPAMKAQPMADMPADDDLPF